MIATNRAWLGGRNPTGKQSSSSRPSMYSGICGPGTLVTTTLKSRVEKLIRAACASRVGGAKSLKRLMTSAPSACFDCLMSRIASATRRSRGTGSSM